MLRHENCENRIRRHNENIDYQIERIKKAETFEEAQEAFYTLIKLESRIEGIKEAMGDQA